MNARKPTFTIAGIALGIVLGIPVAAGASDSRDCARVAIAPRVSFECDTDATELSSDRGFAKIVLRDGGGCVEVLYGATYSAHVNYRIGGKTIDGDSPTALLRALAEQDADRYDKRARFAGHRKVRTRSGGSTYFTIVDAVASPSQLRVPARAGLPGLDTAGQGFLEECRDGDGVRIKVYHAVIRNRRKTATVHLTIRTTAEAHARTACLIRRVLATIEAG
jgi:hypothetical protein